MKEKYTILKGERDALLARMGEWNKATDTVAEATQKECERWKKLYMNLRKVVESNGKGKLEGFDQAFGVDIGAQKELEDSRRAVEEGRVKIEKLKTQVVELTKQLDTMSGGTPTPRPVTPRNNPLMCLLR